MNRDGQRYVHRARKQIVVNAAAAAWKEGVPWGEALSIASRAIRKASAEPKPLPKRRAR